MNDKNNTFHSLFHLRTIRLKLVFEGIMVGIIGGFIVVLYRYALEKVLNSLIYIYEVLAMHPLYIPIWIGLLLVIGYILGHLVKKEPMISGSGIPQVEGVLLGKLEMKWWGVVFGKFIGGVLAIGSGLSLGREGPSVQLGAAVGQGFSKIFKRSKVEEKYLITGGASAGLAAAFNAPLAGVMFALEEVHKNFSPLVLLTTLAAALSADFVSRSFFGLKSVLDFSMLTVLPLNNYIYVIILGVIIGIFGVIFNITILKTQILYSKIKWIPKKFHIMIPLLFSALLGFYLPEVLGGGHELIVSLENTSSYSLIMLLTLLLVKFVFTMASYGSGSPGGIFLPLLSIGALIGCIYGYLLVNLFQLDSSYIITFLILAMAGFFTAVVRAPITGIILITEMTGSFHQLLPIALVSVTAYIIADILRSKPIYEALLERFLHKQGNDVPLGNKKHKAILEFAVCMGSYPDGKQIKEINWPIQCLLVAIKRGEHELIPKGDTIILPGDYLIVLTNEDMVAQTNEAFISLTTNCE